MYTETAKVAVLLAAYNGENYLRAQLDSIVEQNGVDVRVFVSIDLSNDSTVAIFKEYADRYVGKFELLSYGEKYGSAGQNFFRLLIDVDFTNYDFVAFSDQDDIWLPEKLFRGVSCLSETGVDAYSSNVEAFWQDGRTRLINKSFSQVSYDHYFESPGPGCTFVLSVKLARCIKNSLVSNKVDIEQLWLHDWFCYSWARCNGYSWYIDRKFFTLYRQHDYNVVGANSGFSSFIKRCRVILSEQGFEKVLQQAAFIGRSEKPITLLKRGTRFSMLRLSFLSWHCRRRKTDKLFFFLVCIFFALIGNRNDRK